jgi:hypothetical protein
LKDDEESFISSCFFEMDSKGHLWYQSCVWRDSYFSLWAVCLFRGAYGRNTAFINSSSQHDPFSKVDCNQGSQSLPGRWFSAFHWI